MTEKSPKSWGEDGSLASGYLIRVLLTSAGSVSTMTGMAKLKKQFLKDSNS